MRTSFLHPMTPFRKATTRRRKWWKTPSRRSRRQEKRQRMWDLIFDLFTRLLSLDIPKHLEVPNDCIIRDHETWPLVRSTTTSSCSRNEIMYCRPDAWRLRWSTRGSKRRKRRRLSVVLIGRINYMKIFFPLSLLEMINWLTGGSIVEDYFQEPNLLAGHALSGRTKRSDTQV